MDETMGKKSVYLAQAYDLRLVPINRRRIAAIRLIGAATQHQTHGSKKSNALETRTDPVKTTQVRVLRVQYMFR